MASSLTTSTARDCVPGAVEHRRESRRRRSRSFAVVAALLLIAVFAAGCDWLQPGIDGGHSYFNPVEPALTAATVGSLTKQFSVPGVGAPVVVNGELAFQTVDSSGNLTVSTYDAATGAPKWTATPLSRLTPGYGVPMTSDGTNLFVAGNQAADAPFCDGTIHIVALSATTGATAWDTTMPDINNYGKQGCLGNTALVTGNRLIVGRGFPQSSSFGHFEWTALDTRTGQVVWSYGQSDLLSTGNGNGFTTLTSAATDGSVAITLFPEGSSPETVILNTADGTQKWSSTSLPSGTAALLSAGQNGLFFGRYGSDLSDSSTTDQLVAVDANTGAIQWDTAEGADPADPQAVTYKLVIVGDDPFNPGPQHKLEALDIHTGLTEWETLLPSDTTSVSHFAVAGNLIYVVTSDGTTATLRTYDLTTGAAVSTTPVSSFATPIVAEGHVYLVGANSIDAYAPAS